MKTTIQALSFPGFYNSLFDENYVEEMLKEQTDGEYDHLEHFDEWGVPENYRDMVAEEFAGVYVTELADKLGLSMELASQSISEPREYNFTTDKIICCVEVGNYDEFIKKVFSLMDEPETRVRLAKIIKEEHSSRSGFWSFMSSDIEDWYGMLADPDNTNYLEYTLWYLYCLKTGEDIHGRGDYGMAEQVYDFFICGGSVELEPLTERAQIEWNEWWRDNGTRVKLDSYYPVTPGL